MKAHYESYKFYENNYEIIGIYENKKAFLNLI